MAVDAAMRMPQYRMKAKEMALDRGLLTGDEGSRKKRGGAKEWKAEEEAIIRSIVEENLNVT